MNTELFTGKAEAYAKARPSYPQAAIDYIASLVPANAVFADVGAGTGKMTKLLAQRGYTITAVEPNADMCKQLEVTIAPYPNASIVVSAAEATSLPDNSVDTVICAQALHWFDPDAFRTECRRICRSGGIVIAVYNSTPSGSSVLHSKSSTDVFFVDPTIREFPNPIHYTRENWLTYMTSRSGDPRSTDPEYPAHIAAMNTIFDNENVDGLLCREVVTKVYWESI